MVSPERIFQWNTRPACPGPVLYWMQRDQRVEDNWALVYAWEQAVERNQPLIVAFCRVPHFLGAGEKAFGLMEQGLQQVQQKLERSKIPFILTEGNPGLRIPEVAVGMQAGMLVTDFNPLRVTMSWREQVARNIIVPLTEVDAHNICPCRHISAKQEYSAFTLRKKIGRRLPECLTEITGLPEQPGIQIQPGTQIHFGKPENKKLLSPARLHMEDFIQHRLDRYATDRNDPTLSGQSGLSPFLHFGQLSAQRVALEIQRSTADPLSKQAFLEELIVRRELSDNFCLYNKQYDSFEGFPEWGKRTLNNHRDDVRQYLYDLTEFGEAKTHDPLWNAAQQELIDTGKMHGYMRMYWAKKILEWSRSPEEAVEIAVYLNDTYSVDGRDPNGYAGIGWAIGGLHDRPWQERPVFGMIRYMNAAGCRRKFDVDRYISMVRKKK